MKVFCIPDLHFPYHNKKALKKVIELIKKEKPDVVIQLGDLLDLYSFSRYEKDANFTSPKSELNRGLKLAEKFWGDVKRAAPKARCIQLIGNHEMRLNKLIARKAPELQHLVKSIQDLYQFKGVKVLKDDRDYIVLDGVVYLHGYLSKNGDHSKFFGASVVHGHSHRVGIVYERKKDGLHFEMDCGHLADEKSLPLQYTQSKMSKWITAVGIVENKQPRIIIIGAK